MNYRTFIRPFNSLKTEFPGCIYYCALIHFFLKSVHKLFGQENLTGPFTFFGIRTFFALEEDKTDTKPKQNYIRPNLVPPLVDLY